MFISSKKGNLKDIVFDICFCFVSSAAILFFCSRSSFFYVFNNWDDANSYFSMGKAIFNGEVPYRDLFDQKGILLYVIYGLGYLISNNSFHGIFIIGIILFAFTLLAFIRICNLYVSGKLVYLMTPIFGSVIASSRAFYWGGSAEEVMLPFLIWGFFISLRYFREAYPAPMPYRDILIGGILAGCIFNIKFNSLGFYFGWILMVLAAIIMGTASQKILRVVKSSIIFLLGVIIATLPWIIYFAINHSIHSWLYVYLYLNIFVYSEKAPIIIRLIGMFKTIYNHMWGNFIWFIWIIWGLEYFILCSHNKVHNQARSSSAWLSLSKIEVINVLCLVFFQILLIFIGAVDLPYYPLPISIFAVLGFIMLIKLLEFVFWKYRFIHTKLSKYLLSISSLICCLVIMFTFSSNIQFRKCDKRDLVIFKYKEIIDNSGIHDPTLINIGCFDSGLYTVTGIVPNCYFYQTQTIHLDAVGKVQSSDIHSGKADFIISRDTNPYGTEEHYKLISSDIQETDSSEHKYYLYEKVR